MISNNASGTLPEGYQLHWYEFKSVLGRGGYGITYLALDQNLDRLVAIKEYLPTDFASRQADNTVEPVTGEQGDLYQWGLDSFLKEAKTLAKFNHPNIVRVVSVFEQNNTAYMVMEYEQGNDLSKVYKKNLSGFSEAQLLDTFIPILDGLALVHQEGFIHRDIKPANIFIRNDESPVLLDFGSARQTVGSRTKALTSLVTYGYAPFEQYNEGSGKQGPWTDIYALGATIYYGIVGRKPADALNRGSYFINEQSDPYEPVSKIASNRYSSNFLLAIDNALIFKPEERPQNIMTWANMLLGKEAAPALPAIMLNDVKPREHDLDTTVIMAPEYSGSVANSDSGRSGHAFRGLIDVSGRRLAQSDADNTITNPSDKYVATEQLNESEYLPVSNRHEPLLATTELEYEKSHTSPKKSPRLPIAVAILMSIMAAAVVLIDKISTSSFDVNQTDPSLSDKKVKNLLQEAESAIAAGQLIMPEGKAAAYKYLEVLEIAPNNATALRGMDKVLNHLSRKVSDSISNGDTVRAEALVQAMSELAPKSSVTQTAKALIQNIAIESENEIQLKSLLAGARIDFVAGRIVSPKNNNALSKYREVLQQDPNNSEASTGIMELVAYYKKLAQTHIKKGNYKKAEHYIANLRIIDSASPEVEALQEALINKRSFASKERNIIQQLQKAEAEFKKDNLYSPAGGSAFSYYKKVIQQDSNNDLALNGLAQIKQIFETRLDQSIKQAQIAKAEILVAKIAAIAPNTDFSRSASKRLLALKKDLNTIKNPLDQLHPLNPSRPGIEIAGELMGKYKHALESKRLNEVHNLSEFLPGRKEFIEQFLYHYKSFDVQVTGFKYIAKERKASANVNLTKLIDKSGYSVRPGSWGSFGIEIKQNDSGDWRIYW